MDRVHGENEMKKVYIVGKVSGQENWHEKFIKAKSEIFKPGLDVRTPMDYPSGLTQKEYMALSCDKVLWADKLVVTPGYETSKGTLAEIALAESLGLPVEYLEGVNKIYDVDSEALFATYIYNLGYSDGHNDTVEGRYTHIFSEDMTEYHRDVVLHIIKEFFESKGGE